MDKYRLMLMFRLLSFGSLGSLLYVLQTAAHKSLDQELHSCEQVDAGIRMKKKQGLGQLRSRTFPSDICYAARGIEWQFHIFERNNIIFERNNHV